MLRVALTVVVFGMSYWAILTPASAQKAEGASATLTLAGMRDRVRPLLIFAPTADDPRLLEQMRTMAAHSAEAADRALVAVAALESGAAVMGHRLAEGDAVEARSRFQVPPDKFVLILIGKDGGEKLRSEKPLTFQKLQETIDAMPMRQEEMRSKRQ